MLPLRDPLSELLRDPLRELLRELLRDPFNELFNEPFSEPLRGEPFSDDPLMSEDPLRELLMDDVLIDPFSEPFKLVRPPLAMLLLVNVVE